MCKYYTKTTKRIFKTFPHCLTVLLIVHYVHAHDIFKFLDQTFSVEKFHYLLKTHQMLNQHIIAQRQLLDITSLTPRGAKNNNTFW